MDEFLRELDRHKKVLDDIGNKIENKDPYMDSIREYIPYLNDMTTGIFKLLDNPQIFLELDVQFYIQVLNDFVYGVENEDSVFLLDVIRYGLLEIYNYIETELQGRECYE